jgi:hypothetical protein
MAYPAVSLGVLTSGSLAQRVVLEGWKQEWMQPGLDDFVQSCQQDSSSGEFAQTAEQ